MLPRLLAPNSAVRRVVSRRFPSHLTRGAVSKESKRLFSAVVAPPRRETVSVPCRSNGAVNVDILHSSSPSSPILIYLPSGPVLPEHEEEEEHLVSTLAATSQCTIARINYRFSSHHTWPNPLHDVSFGWDWILENLLHDQPQPHLARLGVCGELVGASLATMLALTECKHGQSRIVAAAINNPIADWVFPDDLEVLAPSQLPEPNAPDETSFPADEDMMSPWAQQDQKEHQKPVTGVQKRKRSTKTPPSTAWTYNGDNPIIPAVALSGERDVLFKSSEACFDRFASPIHFFRSAHGKLVKPDTDDMLASSSPYNQPGDRLAVETQMDISHYESYDTERKTQELPLLTRCRAYARIYPPAHVNLSLPQWHITAGSQSPLLDQASELSKMIKRSVARQMLRSGARRVLWQDKDEKAKYEAYAEERVHLNTREGVALWTLSDIPSWNDQVGNVGKWLREALTSNVN